MRQIYCFWLLAIVLSFYGTRTLQAQSILMEAKLVKTPGDTLKGYINFYDWDISPDKIEFRPSDAASMQVFRASEIHGFYLVPKQEWYFAKNIQINFYTSRLAENEKAVSRSVAGTFFLNEVVKGNLVSLYLLIDDQDTKRFFIQKGTYFSELLNYEYTFFRGSQQYAVKYTQYINQLKILLGDCPALKVSNTLLYSQAALSRLLAQYHACHGGAVISKGPEKKAGLSPVILAGIFKLFAPDTYVPAIGVGLKATLPGKFSSKYALIQVDRYYYNYTEAGKAYKGKSHHITAMAGTYFGKGKLQPFFHAGMQLPSNTGITVGTGISYARKLSLEIRSPGLAGVMGTVYYTFGK
jgi:hypothetical protein